MGSRTRERPSSSHRRAQTSSARSAIWSERGPRLMQWSASPANRTQATGRTPISDGSPALILEQASWLNSHSPTFASAAQQSPGSRSTGRPWDVRTKPTHRCWGARGLAAHTQDFVLVGTA